MPSSIRHVQIAFCSLAMIFLIGPTFAIIPISFSSANFLSYPLPGFSLQWYHKILQPQPWMSALLNSLIIGAGATVVATVLGTVAALGLSRGHLPARAAILAVIISPMIVPVVISGVGMYFFFAKLGLVASFLGLILAHAVLAVPFVVITVTATLKNFDMNLVRAAASLGASPFHAFRTITLPLIAPGVVSGALFAFVFSFDEVVVALFISGPGQRTLPRQMFDGLRDNIDPSILAMSTLLVLISIVLMGGAALVQKRASAHANVVN
ncbi:ABC transporter permease [Phyllobacterium sp. 0TCS1.6C]|uniref:ABC transporter permease n=1 Tax=unclassified Phyllobacterium TaxID=2638441 RepID=UPI0022645C21|nr:MULTISPECIES: ABC transporter permease [unclassified Phyllobacterium]MCX8279083.1 ABC transporter permease [Phyllobacterium sp. 0TCS1.6C]MCX8293867.1 ABC transporter permease [Phyllobacterium sp. 0TCS1.6A]